MPSPEVAQGRESAGPIFSKWPFMADTNFAQGPGALGQLGNEIFRLGLCEIFVERNYQEMADPKSANQRDLMRRGSDEVRRILWPQNFGRMGIESDNNRRSIFR